MKHKTTISIILTLLLTCNHSYGQMMSLLLGGMRLNENIEFGGLGGLNIASVGGLYGSNSLVRPAVGIYFDFHFEKYPWTIHTGVIPVSIMGASNLKVYSSTNAALDKLMEGGEVRRLFYYMSIPLLVKFKFRNAVFWEGGPQLGLIYRVTDKFLSSIIKEDDLNFFNNVGKQYRNFDAGITIGVGYRLPIRNGVNLSARYYWGLVNIARTAPRQNSTAFHLVFGIPFEFVRAIKKQP